MGAHSNVVLLSRDTVAHIEAKHRERDLKLYRLAEAVITLGSLYQDEDRKMIAVWKTPPDERGRAEVYKAVLKATRNGREIYLSSVHRIEERGLRALQKRALKYGRGAV